MATSHFDREFPDMSGMREDEKEPGILNGRSSQNEFRGREPSSNLKSEEGKERRIWLAEFLITALGGHTEPVEFGRRHSVTAWRPAATPVTLDLSFTTDS